jgi:hypothetical protein
MLRQTLLQGRTVLREVVSACLVFAALSACDDAPNNQWEMNISDMAMSLSDGEPSPTDMGLTVEIKTLSNRADLISGGDALVEIVLPGSETLDQLHVTIGTRDVTSAFAVRASGRILGVVDGLAEGPNVLTANLGTGHGAQLTITNHKVGGPVLSGTQVKPFVCATPTAQPESGDMPATSASGLTTNAIDDQCNIATEIKMYYRTTETGCSDAQPDPNPPAIPPTKPCFKPYISGTPADLATTTTDTGAKVPYIVRVERGTLNRGIYDIAVLFDPTKDDMESGWKPYARQAGWNGKVVYSFGASIGQPRRQFRSEQTWTDHTALSRGFLVAINSMTDSLFNSNRVSMSETVMMMKEKIIDTYGEIKYMVGNGCSGGSINQVTTASIFPGLLDGIQSTCTLPDSETTNIEIADCALLVNFYNTPEWFALTAGLINDEINAKKAAINGHVDQTGCHAWVNSFSNLSRPGNYFPSSIDNVTGQTGPPSTTPTNNCQLPLSTIYDPTTNPNGVRCSSADHAVAILGTVPGTNRARDTRDNAGVQYGLRAFLFGAITAEEFVTLNEKIGGVDFDSHFTAARSEADPEALATVYRAGMVSDGKHLAQTAIIDLRGNDDSTLSPFGALGIHHVWRSFELRARLDSANGSHSNHVLWRYGTSLIPTPTLTLQSFLLMDQWLGAIQSDLNGDSIETKIFNHRPAEAFDFCYVTPPSGDVIEVTDSEVCDADPQLRPHSSPRQVAGGPVAENVLKCQLKPIDRIDYNPVGLTDLQFARLSAVFPQGVCDFSRPGVGQQPAVSPLDFSAGPGGTPLPPAPTSKPLQ